MLKYLAAAPFVTEGWHYGTQGNIIHQIRGNIARWGLQLNVSTSFKQQEANLNHHVIDVAALPGGVLSFVVELEVIYCFKNFDSRKQRSKTN